MSDPHYWDGTVWVCLRCGELHGDPCQCPCHSPTAGNIGEDPREVILEPIPIEVPVPEPEPVPVPEPVPSE